MTNGSLIDELRNADLSEKHPQKLKQTGDNAKDGARPFETYPGDDRLREQPITAGGARKNGVERTGDGYQLSFDNASLAEVTKVILSDTLKLPYYYDPRVQGQVTLATGRSVTREELLNVLETALKMNSAVLINGDGHYRIAPAADALTGDGGSVVRDGAPGFGVSVLPLRNISAEAMLRLVENFVTKGGSLRAESTGNLLLIRGTARERQSLMEVASSFDVDWLKGQSAGIFPLTNSTPDEIIAELTQAMNAEEGDLLGKMVRFQPLERLNAVLVLARQSNQLKRAADWIQRLDRSNETGQDLHVYRVENGRAIDIAGLLNETLGTGGTQRTRSEVAPGRDVFRLSSGGLQSSSSMQQSSSSLPISAPGQRSAQTQPLVAQAPRRQREAPPSAGAVTPPGQAASGQGTPPPIRITADEVNNLLLIYASPADYRRIANVLREIDRPPLQVMINATIVEVTLNDNLRYGVQVFLKGKQLSGGLVNSKPPIAASNAGLNFIVGALTDPKVVLDALSEVTELKVVSAPSVVVVDNQPAILKVGDEVPISTQQAQLLETNNNAIVNSIQFRDTGVILKVIPRVNSSGLVTMDVEQEVSQVAPQSPALTPTISQRQVASTISVYSGQMVVLGGLISEQHNNDKTSVPIVNKVPVLGDLLGSNDHKLLRTELIVFIRPQVIRDSHDARNVAEELRSRLKSFAPSPPSTEGSRTPQKKKKRSS
ncbi:MAG: type II secretion system secretin GspD [Hyphomicrobiaceae bacterium]|nr:type II secretion system secretin GspD [Hyphomicrobiaceae bacterium]